jgi:hypothetical protein
MSHPCVLVTERAGVVHIMVDGGPIPLCDACCKDCTDEAHGFKFGGYVVCEECARQWISDGQLPDEVSLPNETFKTYCDRLNAPLRARMDRLFAETN